MKHMKYLTAVILAAALAFAGSAVNAQQHGSMGAEMGMDRGMMGHKMRGGILGRNCPMMGGSDGAFAKGRIAFLKAELEITDAQKSVFDAYAAALKDNLQNMNAMWKSMIGKKSAKTPVERLNAHLFMMEGRTSSLKAVKPKLEAFYAALSDDQKKKADQILTGMGCMM